MDILRRAYLTYALNQNGKLVHVDSVPNGNSCGCICPCCKSELCAKNGGTGEKMIHHFAHVSGADCVGALESALHKMAKDVMKEALCIQLPTRPDGRRGELLRLDRVEIESFDRDTQLRPDCIGYYGDKEIWIEFKRAHAVDARKRGKIISAKIDCIELDINSCELDPESIRRFITQETDRRIWIRDTSIPARHAGYGSRYSSHYYDDGEWDDGYRPVKPLRMFAKDENNRLVNILNDEFDMNEHRYYCLSCGEELSIGMDESGTYNFVHIDSNSQCSDERYLHEATKEIIKHKFATEDRFDIALKQRPVCKEKNSCVLFDQDRCHTEKDVLYDLKAYGYSECFTDYTLYGIEHNCDVIIKKAGTDKNAIIINITTGDSRTGAYSAVHKIIELEVYNGSTLLELLDSPIKETYYNTFHHFKKESSETVSSSDVDRYILKFSLFSSGKYHIDSVPCSKLEERKHSTILEHLFTKPGNYQNEARCYSLYKCLEENRKACFCEICWFLAKIENGFGMTETICKRYKTRGTPHHPLESMPLNCPHFAVNKELEGQVKHIYGNTKIIEKEFKA